MKNKKSNIEYIIPPSNEPERILRSWEPESIDWDDPTVCALCGKVDCICTIQVCNCGKKAPECKGPDCRRNINAKENK